METAESLFGIHFNTPRNIRSKAYKEGVLAALYFRLNEKPINCPYAFGTPELDAFGAGAEEGHRIAWDYIKTTLKEKIGKKDVK